MCHLTTANAVRGGIRYDLNFTEKLFGFAFTDLEFDEFQSLDLRFVAGSGLGYHIINNQRTLFDILWADHTIRNSFQQV